MGYQLCHPSRKQRLKYCCWDVTGQLHVVTSRKGSGEAGRSHPRMKVHRHSEKDFPLEFKVAWQLRGRGPVLMSISRRGLAVD